MTLSSYIQSMIDASPRKWVAYTTVAVVLYLSLGVFFGFDVCDNGQYMTMYANMFTAPDTVGYHFMYYLSGIVGGVVLWALPSMGLLGMRLFGLLCLVACLFLVWKILNPHITLFASLAGGVITIFAYTPHPITFFYNILSILLFLLAIDRFQKSTVFSCLMGGILLGANFFSRTPNVLGVAFIFIPLVQAMCYRSDLKKAMRNVGVAGAGVAFGICIVIGLMKCLDHWEIFLNNLKTLGDIANDKTGEATHSLTMLILVQLNFYAHELGILVVLMVLICGQSSLQLHIENKVGRAALLFATLLLFACVCFWLRPMQILWAVCALGCLKGIFNSKLGLRFISIIALSLMLVIPMGCDFAFNTGSIPFVLALPITVAICQVCAERLRSGWFWSTFVVVCIIKVLTNGAYFDGGRLWEKTASIENSRAAGILTTPERAAIINDVLDGIKPWVHPGDTMLVYGSMPMLNYLTDTRPAMDCCWPELLSSALLTERLNNVKTLPIVLRQKFVSIGTEFTAPTDSMLHTYGAAQSAFCIDTKIAALNHFLATHPYRIAYDTPHFTLYLPK